MPKIQPVDKYTRLMTRTAADKAAIANGCRWDMERAAYAIWWIERYCKLYESEYAGRPLLLRGHADEKLDGDGYFVDYEIPDEFPEKFSGSSYEKTFKRRLNDYFKRVKSGKHVAWQFHDHCQVYGWVTFSDFWKRFVRRFKIAYLFMAKKNTKSPTLAANTLYLTCGDGEVGNKTFVVSREKAQVAGNIGQSAIQMVLQSEELSSECKIDHTNCIITHEPSNSVLKAVSGRDARNFEAKEGPSGQFCVDEMHTVPTELRDRTSRAGIARPESLNWNASTAGLGYDGFGKEAFELCQEIVAGTSLTENIYCSLHAAPQNLTNAELDRDPMKYLLMANPNMGITIDPKEALQDYQDSKRTQQELSKFKVYRLNIWQGTEMPAFSISHWNDSADPAGLTLEDFLGSECFPGFDKSLSDDLTALCMLFELENDQELMAYWDLWIPMATAQRMNERVPYLAWEKQGLVNIVEGEVITDDVLEAGIIRRSEQFDMQLLQYDPSRCSTLMRTISNNGIDCETFKQTGKHYSETIDFTSSLIKQQKIIHVGNPAIKWQMANCSYYLDQHGYQLLKKPKQRWRKIDAIAALVMAVRGWRDREILGDQNSKMLEDLDSWKDNLLL